MKRYLLGAVGLAVLSSAAPVVAADLPARTYTKAPPIVAAAIYDWSGFYIGANGGWGTSRKCWDITPLGQGVAPTLPNIPEGCHNANGGTAGGQIGYRWQSAAWVFGLEAQGNWADFKGSNLSIATALSTNNSKIDAFGLFTGQIGYAWDNALLYVKGGAAVTADKYTGFVPGTAISIDSGRETRWGGTIGVGIEYGFAPNWSAALEYDHLFMGGRNVTFTSTGFVAAAGPAGTFSRIDRIGQNVDLITARINYRFGGPVVAKY
jgi:outer membrane immunogenic protein